jgi:hypothetical protein
MLALSLLTLMLGGQDSAARPRVIEKEDRCSRTVRTGNSTVVEYKGDRSCVDFGPPRPFIGLWINEFEGSRFVENGTSLADLPRGNKGDSIWLNIDEGKWLGRWTRRYGHVYRVRFQGRAALDMHRKPLEGYGHFGMSPGLVIVDELAELTDLGEVPRR